MKVHGLAALAAIIAVAAADSAVACDMHESHAAMTTAATVEPLPVPEQAPVKVEAMPVSKPAEQPSMSSINQGYSGCERLKNTVFLTN